MHRNTAQLLLVSALCAAPSAAQTLLTSQFSTLGIDDAAITPDGRYAVVRENTIASSARVYDLATGQLATVQECTHMISTISGAAQDAIAVTNTRAVMIGSCAMVLDLTNLANPVLAQHPLGIFPRDLELTPDGTLCVIRGGATQGGPGGLFVLDLATGALLATHPGEPGNPNTTTYTADVDSVVVSNDHAVCTSFVGPGSAPKTRVTVWDLHPAGGGVPQVVFETASTGASLDQLGAPHDVAITPDGQYAAVRSEFEVGLYQLNGASSTRAWLHGLAGNPGPMGFHNMDSIEVTNSRIVTASRFSNGALGAELDMFDVAGNQWFALMRGNPHDLTITPSGTRALVRTTRGAYLFDIASTPATPQFAAIDKDETLTSTHTYYLAGMDSVAATDERALIVARSSTQSTVRFYDISNDTLAVAGQSTLPDRTLDVAISPDRHWAAVAGSSYVQVYDFTTLQLAYSHDPVSGEGWFPWCDGVELDNDHLIACGYWDSQGGWLEIVDLFSQPSSYCTAGTNSTGVGATLHATGSGSIARNDLQLVCVDVPPAAPGFFVYATQQLSVPFGPGFVCVGGQRYKMPLAVASTGGIATQAADYNGTNALGGAITAGTTWNFQYRYRDVPAGGVLNLSDALSIAFTP